jgi:hypothetical protein
LCYAIDCDGKVGNVIQITVEEAWRRLGERVRRPIPPTDWKGQAGESVGIYLFYAPRSEFTAGDRERIAEDLRQRYDPPRGFID